TLQASSVTRWLVNSEGTVVQTGRNYLRVYLGGNMHAGERIELERLETLDAATLDGLGGNAEMEKAADAIITDLRALRRGRRGGRAIRVCVAPRGVRRGPILTAGRRSSRAARPACSSTRSSATASRGTARRTRKRGRRSPRRSASRSCPRSSPLT